MVWCPSEAAILIMEIHPFGVMKSEFRKSKSERNPKSKARSIASHQSTLRSILAQVGLPRNTATEDGSRAARGRCLRSLPGCSGGCETCQSIDAGFGLRTSGFFRHSAFGFRICPPLAKPSIYELLHPKCVNRFNTRTDLAVLRKKRCLQRSMIRPYTPVRQRQHIRLTGYPFFSKTPADQYVVDATVAVFLPVIVSPGNLAR
jgi:hypothetical protein